MGESDERSVVIVTTDRAGGEGLANACVRRGLKASVSAPRGQPPATASAVVLDVSRQDADVVAFGAAVRRPTDSLLIALGEPRDVLAPALIVDVWVSPSASIDHLVAATRACQKSDTFHRSVPRPTSDPGGLTVREREVLGELLGGGGARAIGEILGISEHTVRTHLQNAMAKLGVTSRVEAAAWALRNGLAPATLGENRR